MPITVRCQSCNCKINAPDKAAGRTFKCPKCTASITIPVTAVQPEPVPLPPQPVARSSHRERDDDESDSHTPAGTTRGSPMETASPGGAPGLAVAGMVLGIVGIVFSFTCLFLLGIILGILGTIFSAIGVAQSAKKQAGKGIAITGLVTSVLAIIWGPLFAFVIVGSIVGTAAQQIKQQQINFPLPQAPKNPAVFTK